MGPLKLTILSYKSPQRYAVRRTIQAAVTELRKTTPDLEIQIGEIKEVAAMLRHTQVLILPSLMINDRLVCVGRFPKKGELIGWIGSALEQVST